MMPKRPEPTPIGKKILARGWGTLTSHTIALVRRDGTPQTLVRETYDHGSAAAVLLLDPVRRVMLLVRQFRLPPHLNGDDGYLLEVCAGLLDGDTPEDCARKEAIEETGHAPVGLTRAFDFSPRPSSLPEKVHCFPATYDPHARVAPGGGLDHEGEDIEMVEIDFDGALDMIARGDISDGKTIALIQHAALRGLLG